MDEKNIENLDEENLEAQNSQENIEVDENQEDVRESEASNETAEETAEESLEEKLEKAEQAVKENFDKYLRQVAEFDNYRKRTMAEKAGMYNNGVRDTVEKLLPVIDNFERAAAAAQDKGIEMILKQFMEILASMGVEEIPSLGEPFDPNVHQAVMHIEDESCDENVIVEVFQKGYKLSDKVIRPSMVKVAN